MSTFFQQTAQAMIAKHIDRFPLLKLESVIDRQPIEAHLNQHKARHIRDNRGRPAYACLPMFKAVLLGQWHSLSDPELEHSILTRIDFNLFCGFDEMHIPDHSTLCRYRNRLAQTDLLEELLSLINRELTAKGLKVKKAQTAVVDATIAEPYALNQCAIRVSYAMQKVGIDIKRLYPKNNQTSEGYARSSKGLADWIWKNYGRPQKMSVQDFQKNANNMKGIFYELPNEGGIGHIDVIDKGAVGSGFYAAKEVWFWPMDDC